METGTRASSRFGRYAWVISLALLLVTYVTSFAFSIRWYGDAGIVAFGYARAAVYWGGEKNDRDSAVLNSGYWPVPEDIHYAGFDAATYLNGNSVDAYGPSDCVPAVVDLVWDEPAEILGFGMPRVVFTQEASSISIPLGWPWFAIGVVWLIKRHLRLRRSQQRGFEVLTAGEVRKS